jgi:hypothetical protein
MCMTIVHFIRKFCRCCCRPTSGNYRMNVDGLSGIRNCFEDPWRGNLNSWNVISESSSAELHMRRTLRGTMVNYPLIAFSLEFPAMTFQLSKQPRQGLSRRIRKQTRPEIYAFYLCIRVFNCTRCLS